MVSVFLLPQAVFGGFRVTCKDQGRKVILCEEIHLFCITFGLQGGPGRICQGTKDFII